ncbi:hypothetical protein WN944_006737 [Citrus x changshan-huyou]|uniref:Uncharacterized protein n=1 Tax=Citrus x changshan-huyou TaxID=2935761 RepID=A0AAP0QPV9_9ROSI
MNSCGPISHNGFGNAGISWGWEKQVLLIQGFENCLMYWKMGIVVVLGIYVDFVRWLGSLERVERINPHQDD